MKKLLCILAVLMPLVSFGQISITKTGDQIKFTGMGLANGVVTNNKAYSEIFSSAVDQVMVQGNTLYFIDADAKTIVVTVPWAKVLNKQGAATPALYVEKLIDMGFLDKSSNKFSLEVIFDGDSLPQGTRYLPDTIGLCMDGYKNLTISGYFTEGQAVNDSIMVQVTNDYGLNWNTVYGYNWKTNTTVNQIKQTGAGTNYVAWSFPNLNFKYFRIVAGLSDSTNVFNLDARKTN
jgi:hypothetical protein